MTRSDTPAVTETTGIMETIIELRRGPVEVLEAPARPGAEALAPLVFLHEGLGSARLWRSFPWDLAAATGRRTIVWSRHGYGRSAVVTDPRSPGYMHDEALAVLPELLERLSVDQSAQRPVEQPAQRPVEQPAERPVLVGHSDGASIALIHAGAGHPTTAVVAIAPHVFVEERSLEGITAARDRFATTDLAERMGRHHLDAAATFRGWNDIWLSDAFRDWNIEEYLPAIEVPVLVVQAADDEYGTLEQVERITAGVAGPVESVVLAAGGHAPHLTHGAEVTAAVADFVTRLG